ncbi:MAG: short-chain dehydrogenase/reductase [Dehalococcoidales bacterium]|nr:short-chain dehydrogenase/reductase [Dehalococcoidales bacterium]
MKQFSLEGKVALVTGGSRGIGKVTAISFARAGADVAVASRNLPELELVANEIKSLGRRSLAVTAHLGRMDQLKSLIEQVVAEFGRIDILVNNAGTSPVYTPSLDLEERAWDSIMNLNVKGLFFLSQAVARVMKEHGGGRIINIASVDGFRPEVNIGAYAISKASVIMTTHVMAVEWAKYNIRVNTVAPGHVHTRLGDSRFGVAPPGYEEELIKRTPLGHIAQPEEMVGAMIYLASDASDFVTGQTLVVDGGFLIT